MFFEWKHLNIQRLGMFFEWKHLNYTTPFKKYWKSDRKHEKNNAGLSNWYQYQGYCIILVDMVKKEVKNYSKITLFTVINVFPQASGPLLLNQGEDRNPTIIQEELRGMQHATLPATRFFPACFSLAMCVCAWMWMLEGTLWRWIAVIEHAEKYFVCINERYQRFNCENLCVLTMNRQYILEHECVSVYERERERICTHAYVNTHEHS